MAIRKMIFQLLCVVALAQCANSTRSSAAWQDIDYSKVYRARSGENDASYTAPSVLNCVDDDLYNCNK